MAIRLQFKLTSSPASFSLFSSSMAWKMDIDPRKSWPAALLAHSYDPKYGESSAGNENLKRIPSTMYLVPCGGLLWQEGARGMEREQKRMRVERSNDADEPNFECWGCSARGG